uniref:HEAT repeat containing 4 n=1 Tax=Ornithorhynchus anatinus TaxID=9258 RepID=A0A6I8P4I9_ORNAN
MKPSAFFHANDPFPLYAEGKPSGTGSRRGSDGPSGLPPAEPLHRRRRERLEARYLETAAADLGFSEDVVRQRAPASLLYGRYDFARLYDPSDVVARPGVQAPRAPRPPGLRPPPRPSEPEEASASPPRPAGPEGPRKPRGRRRAAGADDAAGKMSPPPPAGLDPPAGPRPVPGGWTPERRGAGPWLRPSEREAWEWENLVLEKLDKRTARWIASKGPGPPGGPGGLPERWQGFLHRRYDWSRIRDELTSASDLELLAELEREETPELEGPGARAPGRPEERAELLLPVYYRMPAYLPQAPTAETRVSNKTAEHLLTEQGRRRAPPYHRPPRANPRAGKYAFATDNAFEQEIYFGAGGVVHRAGGKRERIVLENLNEYRKHLPKVFPEPPDPWGSQLPPEAARRPERGAFRWTAPPSPAKDLLQMDQEKAATSRGRRERPAGKSAEDPPWELRALRAMLRDWKTSWMLNPEERVATPPVRDIPEDLRPALRAALSDGNVNVSMAAAVCQYAMRTQNRQARDIMERALLKGNDADSWAAAQCLALGGTATFPVLKRILSQLFDRKDGETEAQVFLLLSHLNKQTGPIHALLAVELNSCQWEDRILACRALSRVGGTVGRDLKNKLSQLMWKDWNEGVRRAAAQALGQMRLGKEIHDQLRVKLSHGDSRERAKALTLIGWLRLMTAKLLPGFLRCFSDDFVSVRRGACLAAGALRIGDRMVLDSLLKLVRSDPSWKIKAYAIRALGQIGRVSPKLRDLLLWTVRYEEEPGLRLEACRTIVALRLQGDAVRDTLVDVPLLETHEAVLGEANRAIEVLHLQGKGNREMIRKIRDKVKTRRGRAVARAILSIERYRAVTPPPPAPPAPPQSPTEGPSPPRGLPRLSPPFLFSRPLPRRPSSLPLLFPPLPTLRRFCTYPPFCLLKAGSLFLPMSVSPHPPAGRELVAARHRLSSPLHRTLPGARYGAPRTVNTVERTEEFTVRPPPPVPAARRSAAVR